MVSFRFSIVRLILENFAVSFERTLVVAVEVTGPPFNQEFLNLIILGLQARGNFFDATVSRIGLIAQVFGVQFLGARIIDAHQLFVIAHKRLGFVHFASINRQEGTTGNDLSAHLLDAFDRRLGRNIRRQDFGGLVEVAIGFFEVRTGATSRGTFGFINQVASFL